MNMTKDALQGNDLQQSPHREVNNFKRRGSDIIDNLQRRKMVRGAGVKRKAMNSPKRKITLKSMKRYESRSRPY